MPVLRGKGTSTAILLAAHSDAREDLDDEIKGFDRGIVIGAGIELGKFVIDGRCTHGLTDLNNSETEIVEIKNRRPRYHPGRRQPTTDRLSTHDEINRLDPCVRRHSGDRDPDHVCRTSSRATGTAGISGTGFCGRRGADRARVSGER